MDDVDLLSTISGVEDQPPQQKYIALSHSERKIVGDLWLDEMPSDNVKRKVRDEALIVISSARYFRTPRLNEIFGAYNWPVSCYLYNVLLVEFVQKTAVLANTTKTYTVAYRRGIGRVTKEYWSDANCKLRHVRLG